MVVKPKANMKVSWEIEMLDIDKYFVKDYSERVQLDEMGNFIE